MILKNSQIQIQLQITGYQYEEAEGFYDDWLMVSLHIQTNNGKVWSQEAPYLMTTELQTMRRWFASLLIEGSSYTTLYFIEPEMEWNYTEQQVLELRLSHAAYPVSIMNNSEAYGEATFAFKLTYADLHPIVSSLDHMLHQFPQRAAR
ncbi:hypothetical protein [Paenibacillus bovis]|uniref:Uncharacterized protein n=1 Tax=Paenibacillus bovis TaxID=1616788 RepID=A0A172ZFJ3_9BACL|nr:hypothetical protein [Paenibacillus bovis]ANF96411.1 hypothetical protein AR543_10610 [Paenibacillus bovis]